jgi:PAS domain S-box-containing protein
MGRERPAPDTTLVPASSAVEIVEALPGVIWEADATDHRMTYVSSRARDVFGQDPEAWLSVPEFWEQHIHPDDRERVVEQSEAVIDELAATALDYRFERSDGTYAPVRDFLQIIRHADGHLHAVGFMVDVSVEAAADTERRLLAAAVDDAVEVVVLTDEAGTILYVNPAFERVTGYTRAEAIGSNPRMLKSGRQEPAFYREMWAMLGTGQPWQGEIVNRRKNGELYTEELSITPVEAKGIGRYYVGVKRDVTRERQDRAVRDWLAASVESAMDAVYTVSPDGVYLAWNAAAARIYGWSADELLGRSIFDVLPASEHESIRSWISRAMAGETLGPVETTHVGAGGRTIALSVVASPVRDANGNVTGLATIARDITLEKALAAERDRLERDLRQAQKMEAIGRLAGGIAHDFNNLLTAIIGYADAAAEQVRGPAADDIAQVRAAATRASDLTRRLLAFSRARPVDARPVDVDGALAESARLFGRLVPERIVVATSFTSGLSVVIDPIDLEQLVLNLVVNAVDAIPGSGQITVESRVADGGTRVLVMVTDTGLGMDEDTRARIFEPFFTTKPDGQGTGLGLATVYAIVQRWGGTIEVDGRNEGGTVFRITLDAGPSAPEQQPAGEQARPVARPQGGSEHVLVVEDSAVLRELASRLLRQAGYTVSMAGEPAEVLAHGIDGVDLIVSDIVMPGMSGPEMVRRLGTSVPVVYASGYSDEHLREIEESGSPLVEKPYTRDRLLAAVREALDERG